MNSPDLSLVASIYDRGVMAVIRVVEIENFRSVKALKWQPHEGINCLIGPGDSGKSTVLDAIDYCIGARRSLQLIDSDFSALDVEKPIRISVTLGALPDALKSMESYGLYLRGLNAVTGAIVPEPEAGLETVLTVQLLVESDLEPQWSLVSQRAASQGLSRSLNWADRVKLSPTRLGAINDNNLTWRRGSILNRLSEERADASKELAKAARDVRAAFGAQGGVQLVEALATVTKVAKVLVFRSAPKRRLFWMQPPFHSQAARFHSMMEPGFLCAGWGSAQPGYLLPDFNARPRRKRRSFLSMSSNTGWNRIASLCCLAPLVQRTNPLRCRSL